VVDAGVDAGKSCRRDEEDCGAGEYCKVTNCADKGFCTKKPDPNTAQGDIVCGCDGITYYSPALAASYGVSVNPMFANECQGATRKTCSGISACPAGRHCNYGTTASNGICALTTSGTCWGLPAQCPPSNATGTDPVAHDCNSETCSSFCEAIKAQEPWYVTQANKCN
jgi:hypothetical protein